MDSSGFVSAEQGVGISGNRSTQKVIADNNRKKGNATTSASEQTAQAGATGQAMARLSDKVADIISRIDVSTASESDFSRVMNAVAETRPERLAAIMENVEQLAVRGAVSEGFIGASADVLASSGDDALGQFISVAGSIVRNDENPESFYSFISKVAEKAPADVSARITQADSLVSGDEAAESFQETANALANEIRDAMAERDVKTEKYTKEEQGIDTSFPFDKGFFSIYYKYLMDIMEGRKVDGAEMTQAFKAHIDSVVPKTNAAGATASPIDQALSKSFDTTA